MFLASPSGHAAAVDAPRFGRETDEQIPGVQAAQLKIEEAGGQPWQASLFISLRVQPDFSADIAALVDYSLALAWSSDERKPNKNVELVIGNGADWIDPASAVAELGLDAAYNGHGKTTITLDSMGEHYGDWPGEVPELPAALAG